jgi:hypothetical protein
MTTSPRSIKLKHKIHNLLLLQRKMDYTSRIRVLV